MHVFAMKCFENWAQSWDANIASDAMHTYIRMLDDVLIPLLCCREGSDSGQDTATPMDTDALPPHTATSGLASIDSNPTAAAKAVDRAGAERGTAEGTGGGIPAGEEPLMNRVAKLMPMVTSGRVTEADVPGTGAQGAITADSLTVLLTQAVRAADDVRPVSRTHVSVQCCCCSLWRLRK